MGNSKGNKSIELTFKFKRNDWARIITCLEFGSDTIKDKRGLELSKEINKEVIKNL